MAKRYFIPALTVGLFILFTFIMPPKITTRSVDSEETLKSLQEQNDEKNMIPQNSKMMKPEEKVFPSTTVIATTTTPETVETNFKESTSDMRKE